jgi:hypothetical protein
MVEELIDSQSAFQDTMHGLLTSGSGIRNFEIVTTIDGDGCGVTDVRTESLGNNNICAACLPVHFEAEQLEPGMQGSMPGDNGMYFVDIHRRMILVGLPTTVRPVVGGERERDNAPSLIRIPTVGVREDQKLDRGRVALPGVVSLADAHARAPRWPYRMRMYPHSQLRVRLHRIDEVDMARDASLFGMFLEMIKATEDTYRSTQALESVREHYESYFKGREALCDVSIRIGAASHDDAVALAHAYLAERRGACGLECTSPYWVNTEQELKQESLFERAHANGSSNEAIENIRQVLKAHGARVAPRIGALSALAGMKSIYTLKDTRRFLELAWSQGGEMPMATASVCLGTLPNAARTLSEISEPRSRTVRYGVYSPRPLALPPAHKIRAVKDSWALHVGSIDELAKGLGVVGKSGMGKTEFLEVILREATRSNLDFLVVEPGKPELYDRLLDIGSLRRYRFRGNSAGKLGSDFPAFDPLRLPPGATPHEQTGMVAGVATGVWSMDESMHSYFKTSLLSYYSDEPRHGGCGIPAYAHDHPNRLRVGTHVYSYGRAKAGQGGAVYPSIETFFAYFMRSYLPRVIGQLPEEDRAKWFNFFARRFENFIRGILGDMCFHADEIARRTQQDGEGVGADPFLRLLKGKAILELDAITDEDERALVMAFIMSSLFLVRSAERRSRQVKQRASGKVGETRTTHLFVLDEAHELFSNPGNQSRGQDVAGPSGRDRLVQLLIRAMAILRSSGQGLILSSQLPGSMAPEVLKHVGTLASFCLTELNDRLAVGHAMGMSEEMIEELGNLRLGQFFFRDLEMSEPAMITFPGLLKDKWFQNNRKGDPA